MMIHFRMLKATVFTCLFSLIALSSASAQLAPTHKAPRNEPLETYDNPPAPPRKIETSPRMISQFGSFTSFQVNVDASGQNILGDAANECSISVNPTNVQQEDNRLATVQRRVPPTSGRADGVTRPMAARTWTFPGVLENGVFRSDPVTNSDEVGKFFYLSLQSDVNHVVFLRRPLALDKRRPILDAAFGRERRRRRRQAMAHDR